MARNETKNKLKYFILCSKLIHTHIHIYTHTHTYAHTHTQYANIKILNYTIKGNQNICLPFYTSRSWHTVNLLWNGVSCVCALEYLSSEYNFNSYYAWNCFNGSACQSISLSFYVKRIVFPSFRFLCVIFQRCICIFVILFICWFIYNFYYSTEILLIHPFIFWLVRFFFSFINIIFVIILLVFYVLHNCHCVDGLYHFHKKI